MQVLIIPAWLRRKLEANNLPLTVVLDTERLSSILTKEDLFFLLKANADEFPNRALDFPCIKQDFWGMQWDDRILQCFGPNELEMLHAEFEAEKHSKPRELLIYGDVLDHDSMENCEFNLHNYETVMLQPEVAAVVVKPVCDSERYKTESLQNFLDVLQKQIGFEKVAELKTFKRFVQKV